MAFQLSFDVHYQYDSLAKGINLDVVLGRGKMEAGCRAKIDTGSQYCLFDRELGENLEIEIESGLRSELYTLTGSMTAFGHEVTLQTLGLTFQTFVYFPFHNNLQRNLLGRQGWLQLVKLAIVDYDNEIYLSPYNKSF